ncbi:PP2C family protein-serine/threonine phosphatase [Streptomyces barringtoniae]|uniref:PP2C family protein-serine/threonine phosphatase n=1 Tax=Streptomyces barringtoniae TaxID=2892029 RepID=UPI001E58FFC2|nr:PP2C family protein-serine/threonine phosphatase [Streptomyces barringtoniae]MCC5476539.1 serine/threonine-protein phosphatase [Streptomyces barringtoniae]
MAGEGLGLDEVLRAAEDAAPVESVDVVARNLEKRFSATEVSFLFVDLIGQEVVRLPRAGTAGQAHGEAQRFELAGSVYDRVLRSQRLHQEDDGEGGCRILAPVTNRGDCIGVLDLFVPHADETVRDAVAYAAHALAYIVVTDRRFTDLYHWGRRTTAVSLAAEIQHQLLPSASCCEAAQFTLACGLVPADDIGGDTYDYALNQDRLYLSITDAMGHDTASAMLATLTVNALRRARRAAEGVLGQAHAAHEAITEDARGMTTGQLLCVTLGTGECELVNAGHPWPLRLRGARLEELAVKVNLPFGVPVPVTYEVQRFDLEPGDRLVLLTDGMTERCSAAVDLPALIQGTRDAHPREVVRALTGAVHDACGGSLPDDATTMVLDWHGGSGRRHSDAGADS